MQNTMGLLVYVVDDEEVIARSLAMILSREGFIASAFVDPREALASAAKNTPPDLLISDVKMPGMTGVELGIQFRHLYPKCRVLLFSGTSTSSELLRSTRKEGYEFECLTKPVHPADLLAKLREEPGKGREEPLSERPNDWLARLHRQG